MAERGPFGTPFLTPKSAPKKSLCGSLFLRPFPEMRHTNFFLGAEIGRRLMHHQNVSLQNAPSKRTLFTSLKRSKAGPPQLKRSKKYVLMVHFAVIRFDGASGACQRKSGVWVGAKSFCRKIVCAFSVPK